MKKNYYWQFGCGFVFLQSVSTKVTPQDHDLRSSDLNSLSTLDTVMSLATDDKQTRQSGLRDFSEHFGMKLNSNLVY